MQLPRLMQLPSSAACVSRATAAPATAATPTAAMAKAMAKAPTGPTGARAGGPGAAAALAANPGFRPPNPFGGRGQYCEICRAWRPGNDLARHMLMVHPGMWWSFASEKRAAERNWPPEQGACPSSVGGAQHVKGQLAQRPTIRGSQKVGHSSKERGRVTRRPLRREVFHHFCAGAKMATDLT